MFRFSRKISEKFRFSKKNWLFTAISGQVILFLFRCHHFRTYLLYMIRYNKILPPVNDTHDPPAQNLRVATPTLQDWRLWHSHGEVEQCFTRANHGQGQSGYEGTSNKDVHIKRKFFATPPWCPVPSTALSSPKMDITSFLRNIYLVWNG